MLTISYKHHGYTYRFKETIEGSPSRSLMAPVETSGSKNFIDIGKSSNQLIFQQFLWHVSGNSVFFLDNMENTY